MVINQVFAEAPFAGALAGGVYNVVMVRVLTGPVGGGELVKLAEEIGGFYVKVVVDLKKEILAAGAKMHVDEEQTLIEQGSREENLWGGGYDLEVKQITYDSIINNKPGVNGSSEILDPEVRKKFEVIARRLLGL